MAGFISMILILVAFHFIQPELDPLRRFGSEYAAGRVGWLMNVGFFCFAAGLGSLAFAFGRTVEAPGRSRAAGVLLAFSSLGILASGLFNSDLQGTQPPTWHGILHDLAGFVAFLTMIPAMFVLGRRFGRATGLRGLGPVLRYGPWPVLLLFLASLFVFGPLQLVGLGQRLFLVAVFTWLLSAAYAVGSGAFSVVEGTRVPELDR